MTSFPLAPFSSSPVDVTFATIPAQMDLPPVIDAVTALVHAS